MNNQCSLTGACKPAMTTRQAQHATHQVHKVIGTTAIMPTQPISACTMMCLQTQPDFASISIGLSRQPLAGNCYTDRWRENFQSNQTDAANKENLLELTLPNAVKSATCCQQVAEYGGIARETGRRHMTLPNSATQVIDIKMLLGAASQSLRPQRPLKPRLCNSRSAMGRNPSGHKGRPNYGKMHLNNTSEQKIMHCRFHLKAGSYRLVASLHGCFIMEN